MEFLCTSVNGRFARLIKSTMHDYFQDRDLTYYRNKANRQIKFQAKVQAVGYLNGVSGQGIVAVSVLPPPLPLMRLFQADTSQYVIWDYSTEKWLEWDIDITPSDPNWLAS